MERQEITKHFKYILSNIINNKTQQELFKINELHFKNSKAGTVKMRWLVGTPSFTTNISKRIRIQIKQINSKMMNCFSTQLRLRRLRRLFAIKSAGSSKCVCPSVCLSNPEREVEVAIQVNVIKCVLTTFATPQVGLTQTGLLLPDIRNVRWTY